MSRLILAGDIGGTKTLLRLVEVDGESSHVLHECRYDSQAHPDFNALVGAFLRDTECRSAASQPLAAACFGVAGPIHGHSAKITNLSWAIDGCALGSEFGIARVQLINDFAAVGYGIEALQPDDLLTLQSGEEEWHATRVVLGAGTGLGEGLLVWQDGYYQALPSEGGHVDFAPLNEEQIGLLRHLQGVYGHVSYERILSGSGLVQIFDYLQEAGPEAATAQLLEAMRSGDPAAVISEYGLAGRDPVAQRTLNLFAAIYGAQAGNLALTGLATGGVYVAGGIAPKIIACLNLGEFMSAFRAKGRFAGLMQRMPVHVVMNPKVGLLGAALVATRLSGGNGVE